MTGPQGRRLRNSVRELSRSDFGFDRQVGYDEFVRMTHGETTRTPKVGDCSTRHSFNSAVSSNQFGVDSGAGAMGTGGPRVGLWGASNNFWAIFTASASGTSHPLYALSEVLTVQGSPVPEPASLAMWSLGGLGLVFARRKRQRTKLTA